MSAKVTSLIRALLLLLMLWMVGAKAQEPLYQFAADDLYTACRQLSVQSGLALALASDLPNQQLPLQQTASQFAEAVQLLEQHFGVEIQVRTSSLLVRPVAVAVKKAKQTQQTKPLLHKTAVPVADKTDSLERFQVQGLTSQLAQRSVAQGAVADLTQRRDQLHFSDEIRRSGLVGYPDTNVAESLRRLPGVYTSLEDGESRQVSILGLPADYVLVTVNGLEVQTFNGSSMDSRDQASRHNRVDLNVFPAELFQQIRVSSSYDSQQIDGGLAGTVALAEGAPLTQLEQAELALSGFTNSLTAKQDWQLASSLLKHYDTFALSARLLWSDRHAQEQGLNTYRWRPVSFDALDANDTAATLFFPRGNRYSLWQSRQQRSAGHLTLQYQPTPTLDLQLSALISQLDNYRQEFHIASRGLANTPLAADGSTHLTEMLLSPSQEVIYGEYRNAVLATESRQHQLDTRFALLQAQLSWAPDAATEWNWQLGINQNRLSEPLNNKVYLSGRGDVITDYRQMFRPQLHYQGDVAAAASWQLAEIDTEQRQQLTTLSSSALSWSRQIGSDSVWSAGIRYRLLSDEERHWSVQDLLKEDWLTGALPTEIQPQWYRLIRTHRAQAWAGVNVAAVLADFGIAPPSAVAENLTAASFSLTERNRAWWLQYAVDTPALAYSLSLRRVLRTQQVQSLQSDLAGEMQEAFWLPSFQMLSRFAQDWQWRFSAAGNFSRPAARDLRPGIQSQQEAWPVYGNPALRASTGRSMQLGLEHFTPNGGWAIAGFYNKLQRLVVTGQHADEAYLQRQNTGQAALYGYTLSWQQQYKLLPKQPALGVRLDYNRVLGKQRVKEQATTAFPGAAEHNLSIALYQQFANWGWQLQGGYRSELLYDITPYSIEQDVSGYSAYQRWDASIWYRLSPTFELTAAVYNLGNATYQLYSDSSKRLYNQTENGISYQLRLAWRYQGF